MSDTESVHPARVRRSPAEPPGPAGPNQRGKQEAAA